ncbi:unnamed protein product, partial [Symbiodinium microadriaticum]
MPPTKDKTPKAAGKGKADDKVPTTKLEFGYPPDLTNALRAISDRATQDLWHNPSGVGGGEPTAEQLAQKHANTIHKLSKRIAGDVRAKEALRSSLSQWTSALGHHLAALVPRIQAISQKLDDDLSEACQDMQAAAVVSATSQEKISQAQAQLGPAWSYMQKQEIYKIAGALRWEQGPYWGPGLADLLNIYHDLGWCCIGPCCGYSYGGGTSHRASCDKVETTTSWKQRQTGKSPRRDIQPPWPQTATGRTPETVARTAATVIEDDEELLPDQPHQSSSPSWFASWLQVISFAVGQGADFIGDLANSAEQDAALPLHPDPQIEGATVAQAEALWTELCHMTASPQERLMEGLYIRLRDFLQMGIFHVVGLSSHTREEDVLCIVLLLVVSPAINTFAVKGSVRRVRVEDGILATGSVRRIATGWRKEPVLKLSVTPWNPKKPKGTFVKQPLPAPALTSITEEASVQEPVVRSGDRGQTHDEQLEEVMDMLATDLSVSNGGRASSAAVPDDMLLDEFKKRTLESAQLEAEESAAKKTREGESSEPASPSKTLYPPLFAGRVSQEDDVFHWDEHEDLTAVEGEDVEYEDLVEEEMEDAPKNEQGETPPELSPEALDAMDQEAAVEELNRLSKIGVIEEFAESCASGEEKQMDLREVYDWRYRDGKRHKYRRDFQSDSIERRREI